MTHPFSIFVWQPPLTPTGRGHWTEPLQAATQHDALYVANLLHRDSHCVLKVVRYGLTIQAWPDDHAVELVEKQIARYQARERP